MSEQTPPLYSSVNVNNLIEPLTDPPNAPDGPIVLGDLVAETLTDLCHLTNDLPIWSDAAMVACFTRVRDEVVHRGSILLGVDRSTKDNLLWGELGRHPIHAGLIRSPHETARELDIFRLVTLAAVVHVLCKRTDSKHNLPPRIGINRIASALRLARPGRELWPIHQAVGTHLLHRLATGEGSIDVRPDYPGSITARMDPAATEPLDQALRDFQVLLPVVFGAARTPKGRSAERDSYEDAESPVQHLLPLPTNDRSADDESGIEGHERHVARTWVEVRDQEDEDVEQRSFASDADRTMSIWVRNQCFTGSPRAATIPEARAAAAHLVGIARGDNPHLADGAFYRLLSLASGLHAKDLSAAKRGVWGTRCSGQAIRFDTCGRGWACFTSRPPGLWSAIPQAQAYGHLYDEGQDILWWGLPQVLAPLVRAWFAREMGSKTRSAARDKQHLFAETYTAAQPHLTLIDQELKRAVSVRLTGGRLRALLPTYLIERFHDVPMAQVVARGALGYSAVELAYEIFPVGQIIEDYTEFCLDVFECAPEPLPPGAQRQQFAISHNGRLNFQHGQSLVARLVSNTTEALNYAPARS